MIHKTSVCWSDESWRKKWVLTRSRTKTRQIDSPFTPQAGTWGLHGVVPIPDRPGDYVFFVTFGQTQGEHTFDEGITEDGVLTWQSQPQQYLGERRIQQWIHHDEFVNNIYLLLRTSEERKKYAYLGRLKYLQHDRERERPVYFQWHILDWIRTPVARMKKKSNNKKVPAFWERQGV